MTVDLSKAKPGWIAHFRCGGSAVIKTVLFPKKTHAISLYFEGIGKDGKSGDLINYCQTSGKLNDAQSSLFDIICLEEPAFHWDEAKNGMAFSDDRSGQIVYFIGIHPVEKTPVTTKGLSADTWIKDWGKHLKRMPEYDREPL